MAIMITWGQKSFIGDLLEELDADLADYTGKEMNDLTYREAADIIDDLKALRFFRSRDRKR